MKKTYSSLSGYLMFDDLTLKILDLRNKLDFEKQHLADTANIPWQELPERLNELPARPARLNMIVSEIDQSSEIKVMLLGKGYQIAQSVDELTLLSFLENNKWLKRIGVQATNLWQPSNLISEFCKLNLVEVDGVSALDIGCGGGRDAVFLSKKGWQVTAIEKKPQVISRAKYLAEKSNQKIDWLTCDVNDLSCLPDTKFNLIVIIRYLNRDLMDRIKQHTAPGTFLVFQAFSEGVQEFGSPKNPNFIVQLNEFAEKFGKAEGFEIIVDRIDTLEDGRPVSSFIARAVN